MVKAIAIASRAQPIRRMALITLLAPSTKVSKRYIAVNITSMDTGLLNSSASFGLAWKIVVLRSS